MTRTRPRPLHAVSAGVLAAGLVITGALSFGAWKVHDGNEDRLLRQRAHEVATVATAAVPNLVIPLSSTAGLAEATNGSAAGFAQLMEPITRAKVPFAAAALFPIDTPTPVPSTALGTPLQLTRRPPAEVRALLDRAADAHGGLVVQHLLDAPERRLGYAVVAPTPGARYVVYAETALPKGRKARIQSNSAFADLGYALYLGRGDRPSHLLASSSGRAVPSDVRRASDVVPFGDRALRIVITPERDLGGTLLARLPWLLGAAGLALTLGATLLVERVERQRDRAERLAGELAAAAAENAQIYAEQHRIATTLQRSLIPGRLPAIPGIEAAARYEAGVQGTEVGGDWYDVIPVPGGGAFFCVGDVVGRGIDAASTMAALRFSIRAHALEGIGPAGVLDRLGTQAEHWPTDIFATVVCGLLDPALGELTVARAGHPDLLVIEGPEVRFLGAPLGPPIGVEPDAAYRELTFPLAPEGAVLGYTDGLVERRGEHLDVGLARLASSAEEHRESVAALVAGTMADLAHEEGSDDVAVLALRWFPVAGTTAGRPRSGSWVGAPGTAPG
jgi:serine phosphatase RsbU (regulator of sigma subunit)